MTMAGISAVQSRVAAIEARFLGPRVAETPETAGTAETGGAFEATLARELSGIGAAQGGTSGPPGTSGVANVGGASKASEYAALFEAAAERHGVPARLLEAVARAESGFNPRAVSRAGAQGLMQIMPATARGLGVDPLDPAQAIDGAARLLAGHTQRFGSVELALAAYNAGPGAVTRHGGIPPFAETQAYVRRVMSYLQENA
jgi:soluble lytic murein transglycosylase-like protein